jgi:RNA polymerase sigma-70 factor (ECF subfamily)
VAVFNTCYRLVGDAREAEDLTQEAFVRAYGKLDQFDAARPFEPWLRRLAVNVCLNQLARARPALADLDERSVDPAAALRPLEAASLRRERAEAVRAAVLALPPHYRAVIELRHYQGLSYADIAATLGLPLSDVKSHLFRARQALAVRLGAAP